MSSNPECLLSVFICRRPSDKLGRRNDRLLFSNNTTGKLRLLVRGSIISLSSLNPLSQDSLSVGEGMSSLGVGEGMSLGVVSIVRGMLRFVGRAADGADLSDSQRW